MNPDNRTAYTFQWNGNVQHTFAKSYLFEVAYTGSHSYNEHKRYNINQATPGHHADRDARAVPRRSSRRFSTRPTPGGPSSTG